MALYRYKAYAEDGKNITGVIDADSPLLAKEKLSRQRLLPTHLELHKKKKEEVRLPFPLLLSFTRELGQLLKAGLPLYESLLTVEEKYRRHPSHPLFLDLCDRLKGGSSLSLALKHYPQTFDKVYLSMLHAAEQSASLPYVFDQLTQLLSRQQKLKKQLISALAYPAFLGAFCFLVVLSLLLFVIPSMKELFEGRQLHPLTEIVLGTSTFVTSHGLSLLAALLSCALGFIALSRHPAGRLRIQSLYLKLPFLKTMMIHAALIRFCRSASILLNGGIPLPETLSLSRQVMKNPCLEQVIEKAEAEIVEGKKLSAQIKASPLIPSLVSRMLAIAEETGKLAPMLQSIAEIYEEDLERDLAQMTALIQPALLLILGAVVGLVVLSILLPLTDVSSFTA